jgi:predicted trehalose synthase
VSDADEDAVHGAPQASWPHEVHVRTSRVLSGEQSNTSVILDGDLADGHHTPLIVKVFRMLSPGDNPDVVLQGALVDAGSRRVPGWFIPLMTRCGLRASPRTLSDDGPLAVRMADGTRPSERSRAPCPIAVSSRSSPWPP